jgi:hypothetical protein
MGVGRVASKGGKGGVDGKVDEHRWLHSAGGKREFLCGGRVGEPRFVVLLNIQVSFQRIRKWRVTMVDDR